MVRLHHKLMALCAVLVLILTACSGSGNAPSSGCWPTEGWQTSTPEEQGMDSEMLAAMLGRIQNEGHRIDSVTIVRHGYIVTDAAISPFQPDSKHIIHSCTKSIVSALIGIAIENGAIKSVEQPVLDIFQDRTVANLDARKEAMTLEHVLTMATGLDCQDSYLYRWRGLQEMRQSDDWVQHMLDLPMVEEPGSRFEYCNGASLLLSAMIQEKTGTSALDYAREQLFGPLGITDVEWPSNPQGINIGWGEMEMKPHDMARIGYLYLHNGQWEGKQIVPEEWVQASSTGRMSGTLQDAYGYQWWIDDTGYYMALGYAGQFIFVVPDLDMVVVFTSDLEEQDFYIPQILLSEYIFAATHSNGGLPANPEGVSLLESRIQALSEP